MSSEAAPPEEASTAPGPVGPPAPAETEPARPAARKRFRQRLVEWTLVIVCLSLTAYALYVVREIIFLQLASWWVVNEPVVKADAIVVLGGGVQQRPFAAAQLHREGWAPHVLIMNTRPLPTDDVRLTTRETDQNRLVLLRMGVPPSAVQRIGTNVTSTYEEALALRDWALQARPKVLLVPTEVFHTRRVNWMLERALRETGVDVRVKALPPLRYGTTNWWHREEGVIDFQNELLKLLYYRLKY